MKSIFKQGWMSFSAIVTISVALSLASILFVVVQNVDATTKRLEDDLKIVLRLEDKDASATTEQRQEQIKTIMKQVKGVANVKEVTFKSKDESLEKFKAQLGDGQLFDAYKDDKNPLKDLLLIRVNDKSKIEETASKIGPSQKQREDYEKTQIPLSDKYVLGVYDYATGGSDTQKIVEIFSTIRLFGYIIIGFVLVVSLVLISNTIRMTIIARRNQIQIMRLVGASNFFIRLPFFFEGIFIGLLGAVVPVLTIIYGYTEFVASQTSQGSTIQYLSAGEIIYSTSIYVVVIGVAVGAIASLLSITRYLRK